MHTTKPNTQKKKAYQNPIEAIRQTQNIPRGVDRREPQAQEPHIKDSQEKPAVFSPYGREFTIFSDVSDYEHRRKLKEIEALHAQIKHVIQEIKRKSEHVSAEVTHIEKQVLETNTHKKDIYHINYLELILSFLQGIKAKVGEAKTWLQAMQTKRKKRGSAFVRRAKKLGTQYSLSQELQNARNVA